MSLSDGERAGTFILNSIILAIVLIVAIPSGLINGALDGPYSLSLAFWALAGAAIFIVLIRAYNIGTKIDKISGTKRKHTVHAHILLHAIPLTYFPVASGVAAGRALDAIYLIPIVLFFITGVRTWKICYQILGTKLYRLFQLGNMQMLVFLPVSLAIDLAGWPTQEAKAFYSLMLGYFTVHFILTGITIPLLGRDVRRHEAASSARVHSDAAS